MNFLSYEQRNRKKHLIQLIKGGHGESLTDQDIKFLSDSFNVFKGKKIIKHCLVKCESVMIYCLDLFNSQVFRGYDLETKQYCKVYSKKGVPFESFA